MKLGAWIPTYNLKLWNPKKMQNIFVGYADKHGKKLFTEEKA